MKSVKFLLDKIVFVAKIVRAEFSSFFGDCSYCTFCGEEYVIPANDCRCTNFGKPALATIKK